MRVVFISDHHTQLDSVKVPDGDILIDAGDWTYVGSVEEISAYNRKMGKLPHKNKICVAGNHDRLLEQEPSLGRSLLTNVMYIQDEEIEIKGLHIYGSPWQPTFGYGWAFNLPRGRSLATRWNSIPDNLDILITHGPPFEVLDTVRRMDDLMWPNDRMLDLGIVEHVGCQDLKETVDQVKPKVHVFGHIHGARGIKKTKNTLFLNASICNESYKPKNKPIVVDFINKKPKIVEY